MSLRVVIAPNALKGSLSAFDAAVAIEHGVMGAAPDATVLRVPVADGGDGTAEVLQQTVGGTCHVLKVRDALGREREGHFYLNTETHTALIDVATASGLANLASVERDLLRSTSYGTGQLMRAAAEHGANEIVLGVGGSATVDGGTGLLRALGAKLLANDGSELTGTGGELSRLERIDTSQLLPELRSVSIVVVCDVDNPLLGERGAARVFGPQKGATADMVSELEAGLAQLAFVLERDFEHSVAKLTHAGAAGGIAAGLHGVLNARLEAGSEFVLNKLGFDAALRGADLVFTAEGQLDAQTLHDKAPLAVARRAARAGVPVVCLAGSIAPDFRIQDTPFAAVFSICSQPMSLDEARANAALLLEHTSAQVLRTFATGRSADTSGHAERPS